MDMENTNAQIESIPTHRPILTVLSFLLLLTLSGFSALFYFQAQSTTGQLKKIESQLIEEKDKLDKLNTAEIDAQIKAQSMIAEIEKEEIIWSEIISKVQDLIPIDENGQHKILFGSYSGSQNSEISFSATSRGDRGTENGLIAYGDVAELINVFNTSNIFQEAFVPSISKGLTETGDSILSFNFSARYAPSISNE
jgi:hypothetical protein